MLAFQATTPATVSIAFNVLSICYLEGFMLMFILTGFFNRRIFGGKTILRLSRGISVFLNQAQCVTDQGNKVISNNVRCKTQVSRLWEHATPCFLV